MVIRELRKKKGLRMKDLAIMLGVTESTISLYENGKRQPSLETMSKLSDLFGVPVDFLLGKEKSADIQSTDTRELTPDELRLLEIFDKVDEEKKRHLLSLVEAAVSLQK